VIGQSEEDISGCNVLSQIVRWHGNQISAKIG